MIVIALAAARDRLSTALARTIERHPREVEDEKVSQIPCGGCPPRLPTVVRMQVTMHRLILCFNLRAKALAKIGLEEVPGAPSKEEMRKLRPGALPPRARRAHLSHHWLLAQ